MSIHIAEATSVARSALDAGAAQLLSLQRKDGCWWGLLASNVCMEAEYVLLAHCLGKRDRDRESRIARYLLASQTPEGAWVIYPGGPGDLNATVEAYQALKLIGLSPDSEPMAKARRFVLTHGGIEATRVFTRVWLALVGQYLWERLPILPPEMILLPPWFPVSIYDFASWARTTAVPMSLLMAHRPVFPLPAGAGVEELHVPRRPAIPEPGGFWHLMDRWLHAYHRLPWHPGRQRAQARALQWILDHQEPDGSWAGIQPPWFYSLLALKALGMDHHPAFQKGWENLEAFGVATPDSRWWLQACVSPVWDTAWAILALRAAGLPPDHPRLVAAADWLLDRQVFTGGDWQIRRPRLQPGGWPFEFVDNNYPDVDDTAVVLLALRQVRAANEARRVKGMTAGFRWMVGMQSKNGGFAAFDADNFRTWPSRIPFSDFGWVTDPPTEDVTGHVLESLGGFGYDEAWHVVQRAVAFLRTTQKPDGSWWGRWGVNFVYGTGAVLPGLAAVGIDMRQPWVQQALDWLEAHQNSDGGFGESCASYEDPDQWAGRGDSTPSQTAWGLMGLVAGGRARGEAARRAAEYLAATQRPDGSWDEPHYTGTGFPKDFLIGYGLYRQVFPVLALARYQRALEEH